MHKLPWFANPKLVLVDHYWDEFARGGEPDIAIHPATAEVIASVHALDHAPHVDVAFAQRLEDDLMQLLAATSLAAIDPSIPVEETPGSNSADSHTQSRKIIRIWPILELAAAALFIFAFAGIFFGSDQMLSWLPWREEKSIPQVESGNVQFDRGNVARTGEMPGPGPVTKPSPRWTFVDENYGAFSSAVVVDGVVYVRNGDRLLALDATTGAKRWEFPVVGIHDVSPPAPAVAEGLVFVGDPTGFFAIDASTGVQRWVFATEETLGTSPFTSPLVVDGTVYVSTGQVGADDDMLYALDVDDGRQIWSFPIHGASSTSPAYDNGVLYVAGGIAGGSQASVYAVDASTGVERWKFETDTLMFSTPTVAEGTVFVEDLRGVLFALDLADGSEKWRVVLEEPSPNSDDEVATEAAFESRPGFSVTSVSSGTVFVATYQGTVAAVDTDSGQVLWRYETAYGQQAGPVISRDSIFTGTPGGFISALNTSDGHELWRYETNGPVNSSPAVTDGVIYFGDIGTFYALGDAESEVIATPKEG